MTRGWRPDFEQALGETFGDYVTVDEQTNVAIRLEEIQRYLVSIADLTDAQTNLVRQRLEYLEAAVTRLGKQDWLHTTIGVLFTIITGVALAPEVAKELLQFAGQQLSDAVGFVIDTATKFLN